MVATFVYLTVCSIRNRLRVRLRRLREPRYLIGTIVGILYIYYFAFARGFGSRSSDRSGPPAMASLLARGSGPVQVVGSLAGLLLAALAWVLPGSRRPIEFSRPEVQFLFQAPLSRRQLLHYKLLRSQLGLLFGSVVVTLIFRPSTLASGWTLLAGTWLLLMISRLYSIGVALSRASLVQHGKSGLVRQWLPLGIVIGAIGVIAGTIALDWAQLAESPTARAAFDRLQETIGSGVAGVVLWPFRAIVRLPLADSTAEFLETLPVVVAILVVLYLWVLRSDAAFEEASADHAEKRARGPLVRTPSKPKVTVTPFKLALEGRAETAVMWKNLIMMGRYFSLKMLFRLAPLVVVFAIGVGRGGGRGGTAMMLVVMCTALAVFTILLGPQVIRNDLRSDLANLAVLRTWPVRGATLVRGELLAPAAVLSAIVWLFIVGGAVLLGSIPSAHATTGAAIIADRVSYAVAAMLAAPPLILSQLVIQNAIVVLFPAWAVVGTSRARGIDALGQRLLTMAGMLLSLVATLLPAVIAAGLVAFAIYALTHTIAVVIPALVLALVMIVECALATEWLGRVLDRTDVGAIEPSES